MGGQNHQPCNTYLANSTRLSRSASIAFGELEKANECLEDLILLELEGKIGLIDPVITHLVASVDALNDFQGWLNALRQQMKDQNYIDLPTLRTIDLEALGRAFVLNNMAREGAWKKVSSIMNKGGFYCVLDHFEENVKNILLDTLALKRKLISLDFEARQGMVNLVLEENRKGNIKLEFARLYTSWGMFQEEFLTSSLISTELWYSFNKYGSMVGIEAHAKAV
ncbi:MAG: hypothetical protein ACQ9MH_11690 [Nitrospinales bacterium]